MDRIKIYKPPDSPAQAAEFIEGLEPKLRDKLVRQILDAVILQADHQKFLLGIGLLRRVENLGYGLLDVLVVLIIVAQIIKKLAGEYAAKYGHSVPFRGAVLGGQAHAPQSLSGGVLKGTGASRNNLHISSERMTCPNIKSDFRGSSLSGVMVYCFGMSWRCRI